VFGWQPSKKRDTRSRRDSSGGHLQQRRRQQQRGMSSVVNTSANSNNAQQPNEDESTAITANSISNNHHPPRLSPPNIKLQPRKKELWLPWPLGAMRNDYYKFAAGYSNGYNNDVYDDDDDGGIKKNSPQQERLRNYYSDEGYQQQPPLHQPNGILHQSRNWAANMLRRGEAILPFPLPNIINNPNTYDNSNNEAAPSQSPQPRYWIKDTTTSMAAATTTLQTNKRGNKEGRRHPMARGGHSKHSTNNKSDTDDGGEKKKQDHEMIMKYLKLQASVRLRQLGYLGSDFSVHLPPSSPTLLLLYMLPTKQDPLRRLVKFTLSGATVSWMHSEVTKYRRFAALPGTRGVNVRKPDLPPFLPEEYDNDVVEWEGVGGGVGSREKNNQQQQTSSSKNQEGDSSHHLWDPFQSFGTISSAYRTWLEGYNLRNKKSHHQRRTQTQNQLLELRDSASNSTATGASRAFLDSPASDAGYAIVTGASRGIGRAIAVELARYRIPLILVARDISRLTTVAREIEKYYNVPCRVLQADLSSPDCASRIHAATTEAGLKVDILINNAGSCTQGEMTESDLGDTLNMIQVNVGSVVELSRLYGKDMKDRRRGRILFVSSMSGALPGCPSVAVYAATKSFEKSLASSLGRELERYGVGVTCLLPGAVRDTDFAARSDIEDAVCFQIPGYAKSPEFVAGEGIKAMMLGYPEVYPGWQNRLFVKLGVPMLPSRVASLIGEYAWSPWQWGTVMPQIPQQKVETSEMVEKTETKATETASSVPALTWKFRRPSNQLRLPDMPRSSHSESSDGTVSLSGTMQVADQTREVNPMDVAESAENSIATSDSVNAFTDCSVAEEKVTKDGTNLIAEPSEVPPIESSESSTPLATQGTDDSKQSKLWSVVETEKQTNSAEAIPELIPLPPAPSPKQHVSSPMPFLGFFDHKSTSQSKSFESAEGASSSTATSITGGDTNVSVETFVAPKNETWYPSMVDLNEYDFRDRRLDY